ncbi:MAG TPA: STAS domain-containing protein [Bryobacteraceae bacterium]|jgi:anti-anti-sigma factor|nr:STAS domain-containing protein [Bryobacteraceae bacterium]
MNNQTKPQELKAAVLQPEGDLVAARLPALRSKLQEMLGAGTVHLTLDLAGAQMVDSAGIGLLISAHNSLKKAGGELTVIHASKDILDLFRTMRIHQHFSVSGS